jgi:hypothetical protein
MEKILFGVISSDKPIQLKRSLATQIANAGKNNNLSYDAFTSMLMESFNYLHGSYSDILNKAEFHKMVEDVLKTWILNNGILSYRYVEENFLNQIADDNLSKKKESELMCLIFIMDITFKNEKHQLFLQHNDKLQHYFYKTFTFVTNINCFALICKAYLNFPFLLPKDLPLESIKNVIGVFVKVLSETPISEFIALETKDAESHQSIFKLLTTLTKKNIQVSKFIGNHIFKTLTKEGTQPSVCVAKLLQYLNLDELSVYVYDVIKFKLPDDLLVLMTCRLVDWICLPDQKIATEQWALQVFKFLIKNNKFSVLFRVIEGKIKQVRYLLYIMFVSLFLIIIIRTCFSLKYQYKTGKEQNES